MSGKCFGSMQAVNTFPQNNLWARDKNRLYTLTRTGSVIMAPKKHTPGGSAKCAFKKIRDLVPNERVFVTGKIMSKSGPNSLGSQVLSFSFQLLMAAKCDS